MACQHRELYHRLKDAEKLRLYARSFASKHHALEDSLGKAKAKSKHWERKAKVVIERAIATEKERDEAKEEAQVAWLVAVATSDVKAQAKDEMARVQDTLAVTEEARRKSEATCLEVK